MDGIIQKWASPYFNDFEILGVFESPHHKHYLTKVPRPITLFGTSQSFEKKKTEEARRALLDISDSASWGDYKTNVTNCAAKRSTG